MTDFIKPFMLKEGLFRGNFVRVSKIIKDIIKRRSYPKPVACLLSEAVVLSTLLSSSLKYDGIFSLSIQSPAGIITDIVTDITSDGKIRAYAKYDSERLSEISPVTLKEIGYLRSLMPKGFMAFTVDNGADRYQGTVELEGIDLASCAINYFKRSEQIKTAIKIATDGKVAAGIMLQQMPTSGGSVKIKLSKKEIADEWETNVVLLSSITDKELLDSKLSAEELLFRLYHEQDVLVYPARNLSFTCRCSEEKIKSILKTLPKREIKAAAKEGGGKVNITCEFCGTSYYIDEREILEK